MRALGYLASVIEGGLRDKAVYLLRGPPSSGKTAFAVTLVHELLQQGTVCVYVTTETTPDRFKDDVLRGLGIDFAPFEKKGKLFFVDAYSWRLPAGPTNYPLLDLTNLSEAGETIIETIRTMNAIPQPAFDAFFVFDAATSFFLYTKHENAVKFLHAQTARIRKHNSSALLLVDEKTVDETHLSALDFSLDGTLQTRSIDISGETARFIRLHSLRNAPHLSTKWTPFTIGKGGTQIGEPKEYA